MKRVLLAAVVVLVVWRLGLAGDVDRHVRWRASEAAGAKQPVGWLVTEDVVMVSTPRERLATPSPHDKAAEVFESLYGADVARVTKTRDKTDDVDLAKRLLATARQEAAGKLAFVTVLCEKAADLAGPVPEGADTAIEAMELLAQSVPEKASACAERIVAVCEARYARARGTAKAEAGESLVESLSALAETELAAGRPSRAAATLRRAKAIALATGSDQGDAIAARLLDLAHRVKVDRQVTNMKALLDRDPENTAAREELVRLYLVDLDNPAQAAKYLEGTKDASLAKYVPAATRGVEAAPELACTELGDWYRGLGEAADDTAKPAMFARAKAYYERFLALHEAEDLKRTAAVLALKRVEDALAKLPAPKATPTRWIDLLKLVDLEENAVEGKWTRQKDGALTVAPSHCARTLLPGTPGDAYELEAAFVRTEGKGDVAFYLPAGQGKGCWLLFDMHSGSASGLDILAGKRGEANETTVQGPTLTTGKAHTVAIQVRAGGDQVAIAVALDGRPFTSWQGPASALSTHSSWSLPRADQVAVGADNSTVRFSRVRLRSLAGQTKTPR